MDSLLLNIGNGKIYKMTFSKTMKSNNLFTTIIYANIFVFVIINLVHVTNFLLEKEDNIIYYLGVSSNLEILSKRPWTLISYMFTHVDLFHLLINLFCLYFGGKIFIQYLSPKQLFSTYLMGGVIGAVIYIIAFNLFPVFYSLKVNSLAIGASASVLAIVFAIATYVPNYSISLMLFGSIKLKHIAIGVLIIDILSIPQGNAGGHIAHIGGALYGYVYIVLYKRNFNSNYLVENIIELISYSPKYIHKKKENDYEYNARKRKEEMEIDKILEKISRSGYNSLSKQEKDILFKNR